MVFILSLILFNVNAKMNVGFLIHLCGEWLNISNYKLYVLI